MTIGSLFAGIGGIELGFEQAGFKTIWANEIDSDACKTYRRNFPNVHLVEDDIRNVNPASLPNIDIITAGFPCQPFSVCGYKKGFADERGNLFFEIMRFIDVLVPQIVFLENVANLAEHDNGRTFLTIHNELTQRDYSIRYLIADACDYGIPQHRTRTYIVAFKDQDMCEQFEFPEKCKLEHTIFDLINKSVKAQEQYYAAQDSYEYNKLSKAIKDESQIYRFSDYGIQLSKDGISFTLKANMGTWKNRVPYIKDDYGIRKITPYECLTLQGFPREYRLPNISMRSLYKQCGNSVVVPVIRKMADEIMRVLSK